MHFQKQVGSGNQNTCTSSHHNQQTRLFPKVVKSQKVHYIYK